MKRLLVLLVCSLFIFILIGCQNSTKLKSGVDVIIDGDGQFPASLAGTWKSNDGVWEIVFKSDGKISSAVISLGRVRIKPGQVTTVLMKLGGKGTFEPGQWTDDTSMALCLATSLLERGGFDPRDQMERYCRWAAEGYLSSTGSCFDIGGTVSRALMAFRRAFT